MDEGDGGVKSGPMARFRGSLQAPELREALIYAGVLFLVLRVALSVLGVLALGLLPAEPGATVEATTGWHNFLGAWYRWDAEWFVRIARSGYDPQDGTAAFFPLYPLLIRGVAAVASGHHVGVATLVSNLFAYLCLTAMYLLTRFEYGTPFARRATLYLAVFPTSFFLLAPYSESLFLFCALGALLAARSRHWVWAALAGIGATATRSIGVVLVAALGAEALHQYYERRQEGEPRWGRLALSLVATLSALLGTGAYLLWWRASEGDWFVPLRAQSGWSREYSQMWQTLGDAVEAARAAGQFPGGYHQVDLLFMLFAMACAAWVVLRARPTYTVFVVLSLAIPLTLTFPGRPLMSVPRFVLVVFPLFWAVARFAETTRSHHLVVGSFAAGLGILALLFANSYFVF